MTSQWCHRNKTHSWYSELNSLQNVYFRFFIFGKLTEWRCFVTYLSNDPRTSTVSSKFQCGVELIQTLSCRLTVDYVVESISRPSLLDRDQACTVSRKPYWSHQSAPVRRFMSVWCAASTNQLSSLYLSTKPRRLGDSYWLVVASVYKCCATIGLQSVYVKDRGRRGDSPWLYTLDSILYTLLTARGVYLMFNSLAKLVCLPVKNRRCWLVARLL